MNIYSDIYQLGTRIADLLDAPDGQGILPTGAVSWTDGGCDVLAAALSQLLAGVWHRQVVVVDADDIAYHYVVEIAGPDGPVFLDGYGPQSLAELLAEWEANELVTPPCRVLPVDPFDRRRDPYVGRGAISVVKFLLDHLSGRLACA